ncbi:MULTISPECIES: DUF3592 domain-containing protein [unclassified Nocardioides]|uniref:DUF3592 domain-containing protein n=1 Tax=unclassified Nocardioides TaxID=2615069 RepID=UPI00360C65C3
MRIHEVPTALLLGTAAVLLVVAAVLVLKGRAVRRSAERFRGRAVSARATVVGLEAKDLSLGTSPDTHYFPRVRFVPAGAAEPVEVQTLTAVPAPPPRVGEQLDVAYDPEQPHRVDVAATEQTVEGAGRTWLLLARAVLLLALGVAAAWLVLVLIVWTS